MEVWWLCLCLSKFLPLTNKSLSSKVVLPRFSSILVRSVREFFLLEAVFCMSSILSEKSLWTGSNTLPTTVRPEDALADLIANSTLGITEHYTALHTASWTIVSAVVITLSTSLRTLLTSFLSCVCISTSCIVGILQKIASASHVFSTFSFVQS